MADTQVAEEQVSQPSVSETPVETSWRDSLSDDIKGDASLENINDINSLAKGYVHAQRMVGADKIALPGKYATEDDWQQVYTKLGRPDSPENYELNYNIPEGDDGANLNQFKEISESTARSIGYPAYMPDDELMRTNPWDQKDHGYLKPRKEKERSYSTKAN